jgi:hypothetical protein
MLKLIIVRVYIFLCSGRHTSIKCCIKVKSNVLVDRLALLLRIREVLRSIEGEVFDKLTETFPEFFHFRPQISKFAIQ